ncbi:hypothetical protein Mgra_00006065 [Meloidogyne graminicola]|uniref:Uncharacterized protein n=1 Tax=Meloidogyne graminicola TaxID=189291 RepID=A0A8S9ZM63_9BILA|nr:hypothetical protein Mgra_00006065 [Meloidogyne graminicola]
MDISPIFKKKFFLLKMFSFAFFIFIQFFQFINNVGHKDWTNSGYPDIRGPTFQQCAIKIPKDKPLFVCDPDKIFNSTQLIRINDELAKVAIDTPCPCQRRSQCSSGYSTSGSTFHGFIVSIALVDNLQMNFHSPSEQQLTDRAESFCKALEGRWALGDCGNSVIIFVWRHYKKLIIWPARLAERYITQGERKSILARVNDLVQNDKWSEAIAQVIFEMYEQLRGEPESRVDTGTLSLIIAVGVASLLTSLITGCVCAFRCCGNLSPNDEKSASVLIDSSASFSLPPMNCQLPITSSTFRSSNQQISFMPSSPPAIRRSLTPPPQPSQLTYMAFSDTTIV